MKKVETQILMDVSKRNVFKSLLTKSILILMLFSFSINLFAPVITTDAQTNLRETAFENFRLEQEKIKKLKEAHVFVIALGMRESSMDFKIINEQGYMGAFQFGRSALKSTGYSHVNKRKFRKNQEIWPAIDQFDAVYKLINRNALLLNYYIATYNGKTIIGIKITAAGILAGAHLGGHSSVKKFLKSNGKINKKDANGTTIGMYLKHFNEYDYDVDYMNGFEFKEAIKENKSLYDRYI